MSTAPMPLDTIPLATWDSWYANLGIPIVLCHWLTEETCCSCRLGPQCDKAGKHPLTQHGCYDATTDLGTIAVWRRRWPQANIGAATGRLFDVLDIDQHDSDAWQNHTGFTIPDTWHWRTGSGGHQFAFQPAPGLGNGVRRLPFADTRARGGHAMLPPSHNRNGQYRWVAAPGTVALAAWPADLLAALLPPKRPPASLATPPAGGQATIPAGLVVWAEAGAPEGERNASSFWLACRLRAHGAADAVALELLYRFARACTPPMDTAEVERSWQSSARSQGYQPTRYLPEATRPQAIRLVAPERPRAVRLPDATRLRTGAV